MDQLVPNHASIKSIENAVSNTLLSNLTTGILLLDTDDSVVVCNQAAESMLQESISKLTNQPLHDSIANAAELKNLAHEALKTNQLITQRNTTIILPGREDVTVDLTMTPLLDTEQVLVELVPMDRYLRINRDASLKEHHQVTRQMVRGLAHEIKNPLGGIKGSAQLLEKELGDPALKEYTNIIIEEVERLTSLVDRMLGPRTLPNQQPVNIHELLERVSKLVELEASDALYITRDYDPSIPELNIDPELMTQALLNVVRNAMQALVTTPHPNITLTTRIDRQFTISGKRHKVVLRIDISDNGPGIPEHIQEPLFYPMISGREGGTGLGLTLTHYIVNQHNGLIEFQSEPGATTFSFFIPLETHSPEISADKNSPPKMEQQQ